MSIKTDNAQIGVSATPDNNFVLKTDNAGGFKLSRGTVVGGAPATTQDILGVGLDGTVTAEVTPPATDNTKRVVNTAWAKLGFAIMLAASGYIRFPDWLGGWTVQWMVMNNTNNAGTGLNSSTFPLGFASECYLVVACPQTGPGRGYADASAVPVGWTATGFSWMSFNANGAATTGAGQIAATFIIFGK